MDPQQQFILHEKKNLLCEHFLQSAQSIIAFLKAIGVYVFPPDVEESFDPCCKWKKWVRYLWSGFWLLLNAQSGFYMFSRRGFKHVLKILFDSKLLIGGVLTEQLIRALIRGSAFLFESLLIHHLLVFSIRPTFQRFLTTLEPVYKQISCRDLSRIRFCSNACVGFTIWTTSFNIICAFYWEIINPYRPFNWLDATENTIRKINTIFALMALLLFVLCGQLLAILYNNTIQDLEEAVCMKPTTSNKEKLWAIMNNYRKLSEATGQLHRDFRSILVANISLSLVNILTTAYFGMEFFYTDFWVVTLWDLSDVIEFTVRLWLMCHSTTDHIFSSALKCIPILRKLRSHQATSSREKKLITLFIVEVAQQSTSKHRDINGLNLFNSLPTNKRTMLDYLETIAAYLIIIMQFKFSTTV